MKILHITPHLGGGVGSVVMGWMEKIEKKDAIIICLDAANEKGRHSLSGILIGDASKMNKRHSFISDVIKNVDIVLVHYWDHPMLADLFADPIPDCRMVWWCHKNIKYSDKELHYPDLWIDTSPVQLNGRHIWSTGDINQFLNLQPKPHKGFNIGYVGTISNKKIHPKFREMALEIATKIPNVRFTLVGDYNIGQSQDGIFTFTGKVDDVAPYLAEMDVFGYPLRSDHYGTCEQALGEAMCSGVVPVTMNNEAEKLIIAHGKTGLMAKNEQEYIEYIEYLFYNPNDRQKMAIKTRDYARDQYNLDKMVKSWNAVFKEMMEKPKVSRMPL